MGRKSRSTALDVMLDLASRLPWWVGVLCALISYAVLSWFVGKPVAVQDTSPGHVQSLILGTIAKSLAQVGQYLLPVIFLIGALVSQIRIRKNKQLMTAASGQDAARAISGMSWRDFELLIGEAFRSRGFSVQDQGGKGPDGGVDLVLAKGSERHLVQCKQWRATKVGVTVIRELYGVMSAKGATGGFVVTSGVFTQDALEFARGRNIELIDGPQLLQLLNAGKQALASKIPASTPTEREEKGRLVPTCPRCHAEMKLRQARKGPQAGNEFWGCTRFPDCRGTLPLETP